MIIDLLDYFPSEEIYVKVKDQKIVLDLLIKNRKYFSNNFIGTVRRGSGINLAELQKIMNQKEINKIVTHTKIGRFGKHLKIPLKFKIDENWFYISELIRTDGHISKDFIETKITNKDKGILDEFERFCKTIKIKYLRKDKELNYYKYRVFNTTLGQIFNTIFKIPVENKSKNAYVPEWMKNAEENLLSKALQGAFDGDGGIQFGKDSSKTRRIRFNTGSLQYAKDVRECLDKFKINSTLFKDPRKGKNVYYVQISKKKHMEIFRQKIGFLHAHKNEKLKKLLDSYGKYYHLDEFEKIVKKLLEDEGKLTITQIAFLANRKMSTISEQISKLENKGVVNTKRIGTKRVISVA